MEGEKLLVSELHSETSSGSVMLKSTVCVFDVSDVFIFINNCHKPGMIRLPES